MNVSKTFTLLWTPWSALLSALIVLLAAALCLLAWRRSGFRPWHGLLELLRLVLVIIVALLLNQPEYIEEFRPDQKPTLAVLWDASPSMDTQDVPGNSFVSRREAVAELIEPDVWSTLNERMNVVIQPFAQPGDAGGSNLHDPLARAATQFDHLLATVFISDGDWNEGEPPVSAATQLRIKGVPVYAVPVGSPTRLPDLELLSLNAPTFGIAGKSVRIPFTIESSLPRNHTTTVVLKTSDGEEIPKEVRIAAMGRTNDWIAWKPAETGDFTLTLDVPVSSAETLSENNRLTAPIAIRKEQLRALVVESYPRWEYRYLRNALSRDPGVDVSCLLFHPGLSKTGGGNRDYIDEFPSGLDELSRFDVVFLGDVGLGGGQLNDEQCRLLKGLVEHQASGLVFMPGWQGRQLSLLDTELADLYPVVLDDVQPQGWGSRTPSHFELTTSGRRSLLTRLADTEDENSEVWEGLPGFQWYAPVRRARAGSEILCVHQDVSNEFGRLPLLVTRTFGAGKVLFMGTDGAWRWREGVEDKYHYRFWGQVVRWMAYQRNMAAGETMRLYYSPEQPRMDQTMALNVNVMDASGEPLSSGDVTARIVAPSGRVKTVRLTSAESEWGAFAGRFTAQEPGPHHVTLACRQTHAALETSFFVQGADTERVGRPARPEVMEEIARVTQGRVVAADGVDEVVRTLAGLPDPPPSVRRVQLWCHPAVAGTLVLLLGVFWVGRKMIGLI